MDDILSVQLAISKLHMQSLQEQPPSGQFTAQALAELRSAVALLEASAAELARANDERAAALAARDAEAERYQDLFERLPVAYVITDAYAIIHQVNVAAETLLNVNRVRLRAKPLAVFVPLAERKAFRDQVRQLPAAQAWETSFQPAARERIIVKLEVAVVPSGEKGERRLGWMIQDLSPQRAADSVKTQLAREVAMRIEAQAAVTRLRALASGLDHSTDQRQGLETRIRNLLGALVPRFAQRILFHAPGVIDTPVLIGTDLTCANSLTATVIGPQSAPGQLVAQRATPFTPEDSAILMSAAAAITAIVCSARNLPNLPNS